MRVGNKARTSVSLSFRSALPAVTGATLRAMPVHDAGLSFPNHQNPVDPELVEIGPERRR